MRVLFIADRLDFGGAAKIVHKQCNILRTHGHDVRIASVYQLGAYGVLLSAEGFNVLDLSDKPNRSRRMKKIQEVVEDWSPDLLYVSNVDVHPVLRATKKKMGYKVMTQLHGCVKDEQSDSSQLVFKHRKLIDGVLVPTPHAYEIAKQRYSEDIFLLPNFVEDAFFVQPSTERASTIMYSGRIAPEKNLVELAAVSRFVRNEVPDAEVLIVGDATSPDEQVYKDKVVAAFNLCQVPLTITGFTMFCADQMNRGKVSVMMSSAEGYCMSVAESMALRIPVVAADTGCASSLIKDGPWGEVVDVSNKKNAAESIVRCMQEEDIPTPTGLMKEGGFKASFLSIVDSVCYPE